MLDIFQRNKMNSLLFGFFLVCCTAFAAPLQKKAEDVIALDVVLDEETKRVGEEAQLVGNILCNVAQGWKESTQNVTVPADEAAEYFFKKIFRGARKVFRQVGKAGLEIGKRFLGQKAGELIRQKIRERTGRYAFGDDESYRGLVLALSDDIDQLGKDLIAKGVQLNGGVIVQETNWDRDTKTFLKDCIKIF